MALHLSELDRRKLARAPLTSVVCQVRFDLSPRASEAKVASAFHEALGGPTGPYPTIASIIESSINIALGPSPLPALGQQAGAHGWRIADEEGAHAITLLPTSVALESTAYDGWDDDFGPRLDAVLEALVANIDPVFEQRIGLRYINQITEPVVTEPAGWREWIDPHLLGLVTHDELGKLVKLARQQVVLEVRDGVRCTLNHGFAVDTDRGDGLTYVIDIDVAREGMRPFDRAAITAAAAEFNMHALKIFQSTVTRALRDHLAEA